jgi:hypothetical protein
MRWNDVWKRLQAIQCNLFNILSIEKETARLPEAEGRLGGVAR